MTFHMVVTKVTQVKLLGKLLGDIKKVDFKEFTSEDNLKGKIILKEFLKKGGFLA